MGWIGKSSIEWGFGPRKQVRVGNFVLPRQLAFVVTGENGAPDLTIRFEVRDGRPVCVEVVATAKPEGRGLRTSDLHLLQLDTLAVSVFAQTALQSSFDPATNVTTMTPIVDERSFWAAVNDVDRAVKAPQRGTTRAELEQVALVYRENIKGSPVAEVKERLGYGSERTAARRVQQARDAGLLPPTTPGKPKAWEDNELRPLAEETPTAKHPTTLRGLRAAVKRLESAGRPDLASVYAEQIKERESRRGKHR
jgi:hypothetical protein